MSLLHTDRKPLQKICYFCGEPATSKEHVPPKCIFPEIKDVGIDYRKNIITVPSCDKHNIEKSKDDSYLCLILNTYIKNNQVAQAQFHTKNMRAMRRDPTLLKNFNQVFQANYDGNMTSVFTVDLPQFNSEIEAIARGLYFYHFHSQLNLPFFISTPDLIDDSHPNANKINNNIRNFDKDVSGVLAREPIQGANHKIFNYQFKFFNKTGEFLVRMTFYQGFTVIAYATTKMLMEKNS